MEGGDGECVWVGVRLRPLERAEAGGSAWELAGAEELAYVGEERALPRGAPRSYAFDAVFGRDVRNAEVYASAAQPLVRAAVGGFNASVFAYGQTGGGKTHTMQALTEAAAHDVFAVIDRTPGREYLLRISCLEIYNEVVHDVLCSEEDERVPLRLLDHPERGTFVEGALEEPVQSARHLIELLAGAQSRRRVAEHAMNEASSRSHLLVRAHTLTSLLR